MTKLIIFDLDGTLLNTIGDLTNACNYVLQQHGFPLHTHDEYRYFIG
ncbi:MAG: HAD hydrolase-like protein, partial [Bacteroidales bacterium]|nr:HAD hydrolase-like protein [Bacteroidales bacterium]